MSWTLRLTALAIGLAAALPVGDCRRRRAGRRPGRGILSHALTLEVLSSRSRRRGQCANGL